jgi:hypothetical protein
MTPDGYVITAASLVDKPGKITIVYSDGKQSARADQGATRAPGSRS